MALVFHQNMRNFGGGSAARNAVYALRLQLINAATGPNYLLAGFTEITNAGPVLRGTIRALATQLDPGLTSVAVVAVGTTALGLPEHVALAWDPAYLTVDHIGHVLWDSTHRLWQAHNRPMAAADLAAAAAVPSTLTMPLPAAANLGADTRGVAYVACTRPGVMGGPPRAYIHGFMHNMYNLGNRSGAYRSLPLMWTRIRVALAADATYNLAAANVRSCVGGDFNLRPDNVRSRGIGLGHARAARGPLGGLVNTTAANPYDFWVVSDPALVDADVVVRPQTRVNPLGSDHAGVTLANV